MLLHTSLNEKCFYYVVKYTEIICGIIPVKDLLDNRSLQATPHYHLFSDLTPSVKHFIGFGCSSVIKKNDFKWQRQRSREQVFLSRYFRDIMLDYMMILLVGFSIQQEDIVMLDRGQHVNWRCFWMDWK